MFLEYRVKYSTLPYFWFHQIYFAKHSNFLGYRTIWGIIGVVFATVFALVIIIPLIGNDDQPQNDQAKGPWTGSHVLYEVPLIDGHNDLPNNLYELEHNQINTFEFDTDLRLNPKWANCTTCHTDLPRLRRGKVGAQFWVAYVDCKFTLNKDDVPRTLEQIDVIKRLVRKYPKDLMLVTEADGIMEAFKQKRLASLMGVEGGHSIDNRLAVLRMFYELGVRYMTLTHACNIPWADASPIDAEVDVVKQNLTKWGEKVVLEMNRLGMMVDLSHVSQGVMEDAIRVSKAPVIFSHSCAYSVFGHHRNVKDHVLKELVINHRHPLDNPYLRSNLQQKNNGIIMVNFYSDFVGPNATMQTIIGEKFVELQMA
jgi:membrane dipeptidase